jgi:hypothetical protein
MNREHVRLMKLWSGNEVSKQFTVQCSVGGDADVLDIDLPFLHPVQELVITIRKVADMGGSVTSAIAPGTGAKPAQMTAWSKNYFAYHGSGRGDPNADSVNHSIEGETNVNDPTYLKVKTFTLKLNGQSRHLDGQGIDRDYLMNRLMPTLHSNSSSVYDTVVESSALSANSATTGADSWRNIQALKDFHDRKEIYVFPFALNPEGANPSGSVNFSKVSHAKLSIAVDGLLGKKRNGAAQTGGPATEDFQVDVYGLHYNWLAIKDGRALTSFS